MDLIATLFSLGSAPFGEVVGGLIFGLLGAITALGVVLDLQDAAIARAIHSVIVDPRPAPVREEARAPRGGGATPALAEATVPAG